MELKIKLIRQDIVDELRQFKTKPSVIQFIAKNAKPMKYSETDLYFPDGGLIPEGTYTWQEVCGMLMGAAHSPKVVQYIADMLEN